MDQPIFSSRFGARRTRSRLGRRPESSLAASKLNCGNKSNCVNPKKIVNQAIYQDHRYLLAVLGHQIWVIKQRELLEIDVLLAHDLANNLADNRVRVIAQVAAGAPDQRNLDSTQITQPLFITIHANLQGSPGQSCHRTLILSRACRPRAFSAQ